MLRREISGPGGVPRGAAARDAALAAALAVVGLVQVVTGWNDGGIGEAPGVPGAPPWLRAGLTLAVTLPLAVRRTRPLVAVCAVCVVLAVQVVVDPFVALVPALLALLVADYSCAVHAPLRLRAGGLVAVLAVLGVFAWRIPEERLPGEVTFGLVVVVGAWVAGDLVRSRFRTAHTLGERARSVVTEHEARAHAVLAEERRRIARELHDVVAHSVCVMGVQAGAARMLLDDDPAAVRAALAEIESTARSSVSELSRMVGILRDGAAASREPLPGLAGLPELLERVRAAGRTVTLDVEGAPHPLPPGLDLTAYRVLQESLTNAVKHGVGPMSVRVGHGPGRVELDVRSGGPVAAAEGSGVGHGLIGMRERVALYGGRFAAGPCAEDGFRVHVVLPTTGEEPA